MTSDLLWNVAGWIVIVFIAVAGLIVLWRMWRTPNLATLWSETDSTGDRRIDKASLSRFQFLIFTFVIAIGLIYVIFHENKFPEIPSSVYILLGISSGSYLISKGIQQSNGSAPQAPAAAPQAPAARQPPVQPPV